MRVAHEKERVKYKRLLGDHYELPPAGENAVVTGGWRNWKGLIMKGLTFDAKESGQWEQFKSHKPKKSVIGVHLGELRAPG